MLASLAALVVLGTGACAAGELTVVEPTDGPNGAGGSADALVGSATTATTLAPTTTTTVPPTTTTTVPPTTTTTEPPPPSTDPPPPPPDEDRSEEERSLAFVNQKRSENGSGGLSMDPDLTAAAEGWAAELVRSQELGHNPNLGDVVPDRFHTWGENVAYSSTADNIDQMWWESDGHRANILNSSYTSIGIAFVDDGNGRIWAVQVFGG